MRSTLLHLCYTLATPLLFDLFFELLTDFQFFCWVSFVVDLFDRFSLIDVPTDCLADLCLRPRVKNAEQFSRPRFLANAERVNDSGRQV